jgi:hypothetical protein
MSSTVDTRWSLPQVLLGVGMPLFVVALSMDWYGGAGVGFGDVFRGADREPAARVVGIVGYLAIPPCLVALAEMGAGVSARRGVQLVAQWSALIATLASFLGGLVLAAGIGRDDAMEAGFPLFCCAAVCVLVGLLAGWPGATHRDRLPR